MIAVLFYVLFVVVGLRFFEPPLIGAVLFAAGALWLVIRLRDSRKFSETAVPAVAALIGLCVALFESALLFTLLPVMISLLFFVKFLHACRYEKPFLSDMVKKVPRIGLSESKLAYIDRSHGYWAMVTGVNLILQIIMVFAPLEIWALYTTLGWYLLFAAALGAQIVYGKLHAV